MTYKYISTKSTQTGVDKVNHLARSFQSGYRLNHNQKRRFRMSVNIPQRWFFKKMKIAFTQVKEKPYLVFFLSLLCVSLLWINFPPYERVIQNVIPDLRLGVGPSRLPDLNLPPEPEPGAAQEALPQAPAPPAHPAPNEDEIAALKMELHSIIKEEVRAESEKGVGPLSTLFPEQEQVNSDISVHIMEELELSTENNIETLHEWAEKIRGDNKMLKPLIREYLPKRKRR